MGVMAFYQQYVRRDALTISSAVEHEFAPGVNVVILDTNNWFDQGYLLWFPVLAFLLPPPNFLAHK
jgi:hypothetical protein